MNCVGIIPARGGSKGIPGKNLAEVGGKPLLSWCIESALRSKSIDRLVVSTDDPQIADISAQLGAEVVIRPPELSGDLVASEEALLHALAHLRAVEDYHPTLLAFLQCTAPLTLPEDIDGTINVLQVEEADSALAVAPFHSFLWKRHPASGGMGINHDHTQRLMRQQIKPQYREAGAVYAMNVAGFRRAGHRFFGKIALYEIPTERCWEIDQPFDVEVANTLLNRRQRH
ncbi:cytidylyltransferase domain-containing protein [Aeoliella sp.]|uniref:acylneuraminate cytidylyltransferase family protein n=1 Tax=Aeoliella sp. TaxID=2795800 RepID=UPI003CCBC049